jgi:CO/xanthine dehydrogenase Mo-binding subunit
MSEAREYKYVGTRPIRPDGVEKVTGRAAYGADEDLPGMIYGKVVRSPHAHARIISIDTSKAEALPGVHGVITAADFPPRKGLKLNIRGFVENIMASDKVLYHGQAVAAVAASSNHIATLAADAIDVVYEALPAVTDVLQAMRDDAPVLHDDVFTAGLDEQPSAPSNVVSRMTLGKGNVELGFAEADHIMERTYVTPMVHQGYIEPHACTATMTEDGRGTIWCSTQGHFDVRGATARALRMDLGDLRVVATEIGGGFGGKTTVYLEPLALKLSQKTRRPVKMIMKREEVFRATGPASGTVNTVKIGCKRDGTITAMSASLIYEGGAFGTAPIGPGCMCIFAPYDVENVAIEGFQVVVNRPKCAAYRAPGAPQSMYAGETLIDELSAEVGMDPIDFRLKNAAKEGTHAAYGPTFQRVGFIECLEAAKAHPNYHRALGDGEGRGVSAGFWFNGGNQSSSSVHLTDSGMVNIVEGSPDIGGSRASMALMAAETLGVAYERMRVRIADTESAGYSSTTGGSRTTFATGLAVIGACEKMIVEMRGRAAKIWDVGIEQVEWADGEARQPAGANIPPLTIDDLAREAPRTGGPIEGSAALNAQGAGPAFSVNLCDVHVDTDTGKTTVISFTAIQDAGKAIHPAYVEGQLQGGAAQGIGWALNEEYIYDANGVMENPGFLDYRMPVASDLPMIDTQIIEVPNPNHPFGVRGCGETPIVAPLAAVGNAVSNALGIRLRRLPLAPPIVLAAIQEDA